MNIYKGTFELWAKQVEKEFKERLEQAYNLGHDDGVEYILKQARAIMEVKEEGKE